MCAWNLFTQATLYNHPHKQHKLFSFQKHLCYLIRIFKFEACYSYDKAQQKQIASQIRVPSTSHNATWDKVNEELYNIFLMDSSSNLPTSYICKNTGHYSSYCPQKQSDNLPFTRTQTQKNSHHPVYTQIKSLGFGMRSTDQAIIHTLQPYDFDTTMPDHATNLLATSSTSASNVKKTTLLSTASTAPVPLSDLKFNPLPKGITTPVNIVNMIQCLSQHPERHMVNYIINGLTNGFEIGYANSSLKHCTHNLRSTSEHTKDVTTAINKELDRGHMPGPFTSAPLQKLHCSPLGSTEKKDGSRRLPMGLSQPRGGSINEGIDKESFKVQ